MVQTTHATVFLFAEDPSHSPSHGETVTAGWKCEGAGISSDPGGGEFKGTGAGLGPPVGFGYMSDGRKVTIRGKRKSRRMPTMVATRNG